MKLIECLTWDLVGVLLLHVFHLNGPNPGFYSQMLNLELLREGTFLIVGGGGGSQFFLEGKNYSMLLS